MIILEFFGILFWIWGAFIIALWLGFIVVCILMIPVMIWDAITKPFLYKFGGK